MISHIRGTVDYIGEGCAVVETHGVGYLVNASAAALSSLKTGEEIKFYTHELTREDGRSLYGFLSRDELDMFELLIGVSGVGPKAALGVLSAMKPREVALAILSDDSGAFVKAPGVGKKTAQMIIFKLKDKLKADEADALLASQLSVSERGDSKRDAIEALISLGYSKSESLKAVLETALPEMGAERIIKLALKNLNKN